MASAVVVRRLGAEDVALARQTLQLMADVFEEPAGTLTEAYVASLLARSDFWALAALRDGLPIGGVTAHTLPMTRDESSELFIYDLAVLPAHQRQGVGRALVETLRALGASEGITVAFVPADNDDLHALEFYRALGGESAPVTIFTFERE
jgi:aminoglycoside 3-N-acetyltransferase I